MPDARSPLFDLVLPGVGLCAGLMLLAWLLVVDGHRSTTESTDLGAPRPTSGDDSGAVVSAALDEEARMEEVRRLRANVVYERVGAEPYLETQHRRELGAAAEALIPYDWRSRLPGWTLDLRADSPSYVGLTDAREKTISVYVEDTMTADDVASVISHEVAHALDTAYLTDEQRQDWMRARSMPEIWWAGDGLADYAVGAGDFAEAIAALWVGSPSRSNYGDFSADQLRLARSLLP